MPRTPPPHLVVVVVVLSVCTFVGCPQPDPPPGPEPCPFGAARPDDGGAACVFPWEASCADADPDDGCVAGSATRCDADATVPPAYDCETCGCGGADACVVTADGGVCLSADVREGERADPRIDDGLQDDEGYVGLFRRILDDGAALTRDEAIERLRARRAADVRRSVLVVGSDEPDTDALLAPLFDGTFGEAVTGDTCAAVAEQGLRSDDDDGRVVLTPRDRADDAGCLFPGVFARCEFPSVAGCATVAGLLPDSLLLLGQQAVLDADNALLRKATRANRAQWLPRMDAQLALFSDVFSRAVDARFFVDGTDTALRFVVDEERADLLFGLALSRAVPAQLRTFRLMWSDASLQQFMTTHDITPDECAFEVRLAPDDSDADEVDVDCVKNGASVVGTVIGGDLSGLAVTAP